MSVKITFSKFTIRNILVALLVLLGVFFSQFFVPTTYAVLRDCVDNQTPPRKVCTFDDTQEECLDLNGPNARCVPKSALGNTAIDTVIGTVAPPRQISSIGYGAGGISTLLSNIVKIIYSIAAVVTVFMVIFSAFQWIISGGDKEKIAAARGRLTWAIIGIVVLALTFLLLRVLGTITGFTFFV